MSVKSKFSSFRKKYITLNNWMDFDAVKGNAQRVGMLFKELRTLNKSKRYDSNLTFDSWCEKKKISVADLKAYTARVFKFLIAYLCLFAILFIYGISLLVQAKYILSIYLFVLSLTVLLYSFNQYMIWALLKMRKLKCSLSELKKWTFNKK